MYKKATQLKLRFNTTRGLLSVEQLWDLTPTMLKSAIETQYASVKEASDGLDFLGESTVDPIEQLKFDILKDVYLTKKEQAVEAKKIAEKKTRNKQIMEIIARKQDEELNGKSIEELTKMLED